MIAAGLKTLEQRALLRAHPGDIMQGQCVDAPLSAADYAALRRERPGVRLSVAVRSGGRATPPG
ncbi:MAG TPA: hypothetical protein VF203_04405 [Burkholderiales bacterium]